MKYVFVGDAYVTLPMMEAAAEATLLPGDSASFAYFGEKNRADMRNTVKMIEAGRREELSIPEELYSLVKDCDILVVHLCPVNRDLLEKAGKLQAVLSCRGGRENIDIATCTEKGITVTTNPAHNANAVAEYAIGLMLCETRNIARADRALKEGVWREKYPNTVSTIRELSDMTVGIIGYGSVGRLVAKKLAAFNARVLIYDPYVDESAYDFLNARFVNMDTLLMESDIITLHARASSYLLDYAEFSKMKPTAYVINTARSIMINPEALKDAMDTHKILGAAIDVFESEPNIPEFYKGYDNITITNHRGGDTINSYSDSPKFAIKNYRGYKNGERLLFCANPETLH